MLLRLLAISLILYVPVSVALERITVLGLFKGKAMLILDGEQRLLREGETSPEGVTLVSADSEQAVIEIGGKRSTYALGSHIGSSYSSPELPAVSIWPNSSGMYTVTGSINGFTVDFIVDTGATLISMSAREAKRLGLDYRIRGKRSYSSTASGIAKIFVMRLERVRIGDVELKDVAAAVHDGDFPQTALLGMSFLGQLDMQRQGKILELRKKF